MFGIEESPLRRVRFVNGKTVKIIIESSNESSKRLEIKGEVKKIIEKSIFLEIPEQMINTVINSKGKDIAINHFAGKNCYIFEGVLSDYSLGSPFIAIVDLKDLGRKPAKCRLHSRSQAEIPFVFTIPMENVCGDDEILKRHSAKTLNISMGGALFITDYKIDTSSVVTLFFDHEVSKFKEEINTIKEEINTIKEEINTIKEEMNTIKEEMNTIFKVFSNRHIKLKGRAVRRRNLGKGQYEVAVAFIENTEGTAVDLQQFIMNLESGFGEEL